MYFPRNWEFGQCLTQYCAGYKIEKNERGGACSAYGVGRGLYRVFVGKPEGKIPLARPRRSWKVNIKMDLQEVGWGVWTGLSWLRIGTGGGHL
jgi:hypothetical protein